MVLCPNKQSRQTKEIFEVSSCLFCFFLKEGWNYVEKWKLLEKFDLGLRATRLQELPGQIVISARRTTEWRTRTSYQAVTAHSLCHSPAGVEDGDSSYPNR